jgi:hypothetical protein
MQIVV